MSKRDLNYQDCSSVRTHTQKRGATAQQWCEVTPFQSCLAFEFHVRHGITEVA
ncbi:hypothetical protein IQ278_09225 [Tolypothrix sp. LEGE 11397]|uniref:hypothetical protein n=1 Tax=unclassified Tolypothrix TaxID=2649714 RepID=UPI001880D4A3|nr:MULTISPECIES: hypothetical protein [unclassified Tolypothrix]MBE9082303.1 hypothetical protein [Tolypothrix sp. LEGE 11397]UYD30752.1 hypothetical protein HGR01_38290 [Tolypothrix sp. PCC 7712]